MSYRILLLLLMPAFSLGACGKKKCNRPSNIVVHISGFDSTDLVEMRKLQYERGTGFTRLIDVDTPRYEVHRAMKGYTLARHHYNSVDPAFDYVFEIGQHTYKVWDFWFEDRKEKQESTFGEEDPCFDETHYKINDSAYTFLPDYDYNYGRVDIGIKLP